MNYRQGFTLLELLVVIAIIGILSTVVLASLGSARRGAQVAAGKTFDQSVQRKLFLDSMLNISVNNFGSFDFKSGANPTSTDSRNIDLNTEGVYNNAIKYLSFENNETLDDRPGYLGFNFPSNSYPQSINQDYVFTAWVNPSTNEGEMPVIASRFSNGGYNGMLFGIEDGLIFLELNNGTRVSSELGVNENAWQSIAAQYRWEGGTGEVDFFINGSDAGSSVMSPGGGLVNTPIINSKGGTNPKVMYVGFDESGDKTFKGSISDPRFYVGRIND